MEKQLIRTFIILGALVMMVCVNNYSPYETEAETTTSVVATTTEATSFAEETSSTEVLCTEVSTTKETSTSQTTVTQILTAETSTTQTTTTEPIGTEPPVTEYETTIACNSSWNGEILTKTGGTAEGPSGHETYYNLDMTNCINNLKNLGYDYESWIRDDGVKMFGPYILCAANLELRPKGTLLETSLGTAIVCDTGGFAINNPTQIDIAVTW